MRTGSDPSSRVEQLTRSKELRGTNVRFQAKELTIPGKFFASFAREILVSRADVPDRRLAVLALDRGGAHPATTLLRRRIVSAA